MDPIAASFLNFFFLALLIRFSDLRAIDLALNTDRTNTILDETFDNMEDLKFNSRNDHFRRKREIVKRRIMNCCGLKACMDPTFNGTRVTKRRVQYEVLGFDQAKNQLIVKKKKRPGIKYTAVAKFVSGGLSISCAGCPDGWQNDLRLGDGVGTVAVKCPGCGPGWRKLLPSNFKTNVTESGTEQPEKDGEDSGNNAEETTDEVEVETKVIEEGEDTTSEETTASSSEEASTEESTSSQEITTETESTTENVTSSSTTPPTSTTTAKTLQSTSKPALALPAGFTIPAGIKLPDNLGGLAAMLG
ncbi:uncharacterized protein LOC132196993 [Neocloeon triangulifer]|uniref:uncharacterized protein LOC132196993 n=1 Tax=Neocloeon triangulifer TaxID=2078957 RepID=UPI00286F783F|nr:uncharacterized protein LOC132196993 [Neocloeon triangulifer]